MNKILVQFLFLLFLLALCVPAKVLASEIAVTIAPQKYIVSRLLGSDEGVFVVVPSGKDPEMFEPTIADIQKMVAVKAYFVIGHSHFFSEQRFVDRIKGMREEVAIIPSFSKQVMDEHDPHAWLSIPCLIDFTERAQQELQKLFPSRVQEIQQNAVSLKGELEAFHKELQHAFVPYKGKTFFSVHPYWTYFAKDYSLRQLPLEEEGKEVSTVHLKEVVAEVRAQKISTVFSGVQTSKKLTASLKEEATLAIVEVDPFAENVIENLKHFSTLLRESFN